ncbi:hypothetical protein TWF718_007943 [Orbilia javanica]|uniref:Uncharacterized protein n=1 Tax=Orbilia javanica TaxID=47235 RepID=A0AAN8RMM1_9PEZI
MGSLSLKATIDRAFIDTHPNELFCVSRKVDGIFTRFIKSDGKLQENIDLSWTNIYRVYFATEQGDKFTDRRRVEYGQTLKYITGRGLQEATGDPDRSGRFTIIGSPGPEFSICIETLVGDDWVLMYTRAYLDSNDSINIQPFQDYALHWSTGTAPTPATTIHFTSYHGSQISKTVRYGYSTPNKPESGEKFAWHE